MPLIRHWHCINVKKKKKNSEEREKINYSRKFRPLNDSSFIEREPINERDIREVKELKKFWKCN